jgi:hypothetical protein
MRAKEFTINVPINIKINGAEDDEEDSNMNDKLSRIKELIKGFM